MGLASGVRCYSWSLKNSADRMFTASRRFLKVEPGNHQRSLTQTNFLCLQTNLIELITTIIVVTHLFLQLIIKTYKILHWTTSVTVWIPGIEILFFLGNTHLNLLPFPRKTTCGNFLCAIMRLCAGYPDMENWQSINTCCLFFVWSLWSTFIYFLNQKKSFFLGLIASFRWKEII